MKRLVAVALSLMLVLSVSSLSARAATVPSSATAVGIADSSLYFASQALVDSTNDKIDAMGVKNVRLFVPWAGAEPAKGTYDWTNADKEINSAVARGYGIVVTVVGSPAWAVAPGNAPVSSPPANAADYGNFMSVMATRFKGKISAYEIWNEPNGSASYSPNPDPAKYTLLLKDAYPKLKQVDPTLTVIGGVMGAVPTTSTTINSPAFLQGMYDAGAQGYFDAISYHPYQFTTPYSQGAGLGGSPLNEVNSMRSMMVAKGDGAKKIWATEYGLATSIVSEQQQGSYIQDFLAAWKTQSFSGPAFIYTTVDVNTASTNPQDTFGVFHSDGTPKTAGNVVRSFATAR